MSKANIDNSYTGKDIDDLLTGNIVTYAISSTATGITSVAPDVSLGDYFIFNCAAAVTGTLLITNPINGPGSTTRTKTITIQVTDGGGPVGALSWGTAYAIGTTLPTTPGSAVSKTGTFKWNGTKWVSIGGTAVGF